MAGAMSAAGQSSECYVENVKRSMMGDVDGAVASSPTSVLVQEEDAMGMSSCWDYSSTPGKNSSAMETAAAAAVERKLCSRESLIETLQTCLTSLPNSTTTKSFSTASDFCQQQQPWLVTTKLSSSSSSSSSSALAASPRGAAPAAAQSINRVPPARPAALAAAACKAEEEEEEEEEESVEFYHVIRTQQKSSAVGRLMINSSHSVGAATSKVAKKKLQRRSRASRRVPTTVLNAEPSDFLHLVQRLTGVISTTICNDKKPVQLLRLQPRRPTISANKQQQPVLQASPLPPLPPLSSSPTPSSPSCPHASISSSLTGLMYQPEEVMAFLKTVQNPLAATTATTTEKTATTTTATSATTATTTTATTATAACSFFSCHSWEDQLGMTAIKPNSMEAVSFSSSATRSYQPLDHHHHHDNNDNNNNNIKHSCCYNNSSSSSSNRFEQDFYFSAVTSDHYLPKPNFCDQEEIDSWLMMPC